MHYIQRNNQLQIFTIHPTQRNRKRTLIITYPLVKYVFIFYFSPKHLVASGNFVYIVCTSFTRLRLVHMGSRAHCCCRFTTNNNNLQRILTKKNDLSRPAGIPTKIPFTYTSLTSNSLMTYRKICVAFLFFSLTVARDMYA